MKTLTKLSTLLFVAIISLASCDLEEVIPNSPTGDNDFPGNNKPTQETLFSSVPDPVASKYHTEDNCSEGGRHRYYTSNSTPSRVTNEFEEDLKFAIFNIVPVD